MANESVLAPKSCRPVPKDREHSSSDAAAPSKGVARHLTTTWGTHVLPPDLIDKAVYRLGILGLLSAAAHPLLHFGTRAVLPAECWRQTLFLRFPLLRCGLP